MYRKLTSTTIHRPCTVMLSSLCLMLLRFVVADGGYMVRTLPGFPGELPFTLETGYIGVGEEENIQLYYYFVESLKDPVNDPLFLWLNGGPGCSTLSAILYEIGPIQFNYEGYNGDDLPPLISNPYTFTQLASFIFVDAPVGSGFSYSKTHQGYDIKDDIDAAYVNYQFLQKWLIDHPKFQKNSLYIAGDSYSGKIVPILVNQIHTGLKVGDVPKMNLKGYVLGNPFTDEVIDKGSKVPIAHRLGFVSDKLYESFKVNCGDEYLHEDINNALCLKDQQEIEKSLKYINEYYVLEENCEFSPEAMHLENEGTVMDSNISIQNVVEALHGKKPWCRVFNYVLSYIWANDPRVQEVLHVRKGTKDYWRRRNTTLSGNYPSKVIPSVVDYHQSLFDSGYRALIYSGDHDMCVSYLGTKKWIASLNLTTSNPWRPWNIDTQTVGFTSTYKYKDTYELTFATLMGAGHTAPEYKPRPCLEMLDRWLNDSKL